MAKIHVIHENDAWVEPLRAAFKELRLPFEEWFTSDGVLDFSATPPAGVFYNRMSASSHTRGHRYAPELTSGVLAWLEAHGRRVVNNSRALQLEINKLAQYGALALHGIRTPRTVAALRRRNPSVGRSSRSTTALAKAWASVCFRMWRSWTRT
jgi:glutathione synthase/RimK-type ligase-like ATP-grasp enzyme